MASASPALSSQSDAQSTGFVPLVNVVDFHHARGPEVERWFGVEEGRDPAAEWDWGLLPFMALSDGAHASTEDFSYFTLLRPATDDSPATSLFGISCTMQMDASLLINRPPEVTRSTVQKAVVVIADTPQFFGMLRERLSVVTRAWFAQREFTDTEILRRFQESLADEKARGQLNGDDTPDQYVGMSLRELVREFKWQTLVLLKCSLLQYKMLFFGTRCERLCMMQFSLISLIPGLLKNLEDCAGPELNHYEKRLSRPTTLRTSDRNSLLTYMGLPLQVFGKGSLFGPYTPLQQLDILADFGTKSYIVGSTNSLLLQQKDRYSDILINLDEETINVTSTSLRNALVLSHADRRWIDFITQEVNDTWDETNPGRPITMGYRGSEEFIRLQFEEYILSLISSVKYHSYLQKNAHDPKAALPDIEGDPSADFGPDWIEAWKKTENYRLWDANTDSHLFDIVVPKHPCAGGLTIDDVQRRIQQQVQELHLDERFAVGREVLGRNLAAGRDKANLVFNKLYADVEAMREAQRKGSKSPTPGSPSLGNEKNEPAADSDSSKTQQQSNTVGARASAYFGSWTSWAGEKRKTGWGGRSTSGNQSSNSANSGNGGNGGGGGGGGWGFGSIRKIKTGDTGSGRNSRDGGSRTGTAPTTPTTDGGKFPASIDGTEKGEAKDDERPPTQASFSESLLDGVASSEDGTESNLSASPGKRRKDPPPQNTVELDQVKEEVAAPGNDAQASSKTPEGEQAKADDAAEEKKTKTHDPPGGEKEGEGKTRKTSEASDDEDDEKKSPIESKYADAIAADADVWAD